MTREIPVVTRVSVDAPAKINLGLEILGRRGDGYHDIRTILQTIELTDRIALVAAPAVSIESDHGDLANGENLALTAISMLRARSPLAAGARIVIEKRIPVAAGLGGASSDAAAALLAGRKLWQLTTTDDELHEMAARLGTDVPFFLHGGTAFASGRGDILETLPAPTSMWFVLVAPRVVLPRKTASLYAALRPNDYSDGGLVTEQRDRLRCWGSLSPALLVNAFTRPLYALAPAVAELPSLMRRYGAPHVSLSGAGPAHYTFVEDHERAARMARDLRGAVGARAQVLAVAASARGPHLTVARH